MNKTAEIKCATCNVALQGPVESKPDDMVTCPACGQGDTFDNVMREVRDHIKEQMADYASRVVMEPFRRSKLFKVSQTPRVKKRHRFVVNLDLHS